MRLQQRFTCTIERFPIAQERNATKSHPKMDRYHSPKRNKTIFIVQGEIMRSSNPRILCRRSAQINFL